MDNRYQKFLEVQKHQSFSLAAKKLNISQPAITLAVASLESHLNAKLFTRKSNKVELTEAGKLTYSSALKMSKLEAKLLTDLSHKRQPDLKKIGVIDSIGYLLYSSAKDSKWLNNLEIMVDNSKKIINEIIDNKIEVGLITAQPGKFNKNLIVSKLKNEKFVFVRSKKLDKLKDPKIIDDWLAFNKESTTYNYFIKQFNKIGLKVTPIFFSTSIELLKDMTIAGKGSALLPEHLVESAITKGDLIVIKTAPLNRPIWAIFKNKKNRPSEITDHVNVMLAK